jgi:hypothetical protein
MRQLVIAMIFLSCVAVCFAQSEYWGPASFVGFNQWEDSCFNLFGYCEPTVFPNDSLMICVHVCWGQFRLAYSRYFDDCWQNPIDIGVIGHSPFIICSQETTLYFSSYDYGGYGNLDILAARFSNFTVDSVWNLGPEINTSADESSPSLTSDGQKIFFLRNYTIMSSEKVNGQFSQAVPLPECINDTSAYQEWSPRISANGQKLYFTRSLGIMAPAYMYVSYFMNGSWQEEIRLNNNINFRLNEPYPGEPYAYTSDPAFTPDGAKMYFTYYGFPGGEPGANLMYSELIQPVPSTPNNLPSSFTLNTYPNPFNSQTLIEIRGSYERISNISIYNLTGQLVRTLPASPKVVWDGRDSDGNNLVSGIYFVKATSANNTQNLKITLIR